VKDPAKDPIRERMRALRAALTPHELRERSEAIVAGIHAMVVEMTGAVCGGYLAKPDEVQIDDFLSNWLGCGARICVPKFRPATQLYDMVWLDDLNKVTSGKHGVREPITDETAWLYEVDFILVPGVAFDLTGGRLGHGLGYYDRLLTGVSAPKIGVAFDFQLVDSLPLTEQDIRMDGIVTESRSLWMDES
jgi:5-formyltetrahydrofolate cyclo-ligase